MDTAQPKRRLKAFLKHATIRISTKQHGDDSASAYSIDDDGRSQRSSNSTKKDSKLRRIGRGIRQWTSKRKKLRGDSRAENAHTLEGKRFSSSEESISEQSFDSVDFSDEDEPIEIIHEEVAVQESARAKQVTPRGDESEAQSGKDVTLPQTSLPLPTPINNLLVGPDLPPHDRSLSLKPKNTVFRRDRKRAFDFAQSTLNTQPALWTDASHRPVRLKGCKNEHHGGIAVALKLGQRWTVHYAYTSGVTDAVQLESRAILVAIQWAEQEKKSGTLGEGTIHICSDSDASLQWIEKTLALDAAIDKVVQEARKLEAGVKDFKRAMRLSGELAAYKTFRFSEYSCPEQSTAASIGMRILKQYFELRGLGSWVEFHWAPTHSGLPGNEVADRMSWLSCWWLAKVAPRSAQGTGLATPLEVLTFDEPLIRHCPYKGQPGYRKYLALQIVGDTKSSHVVLAPGTESRNTTSVGRIKAGPDDWALEPAPQGTCRLLEAPSTWTSPEDGDIKLNVSNPSIRMGTPPNHSKALELRKQMGPTPQPSPPSPRRKNQRGIIPTVFENLLCDHCSRKGHLTHQCFEIFPGQKLKFHSRLEKVMPGAFYHIARLHPHLIWSIHGQDSTYTVGRVGMSPHRKWLRDLMKEAYFIYRTGYLQTAQLL